MRNNCNKHRGKITWKNGWCNHAYAIASLISSGWLCAFLLYQSIKYCIRKAFGDIKQYIFNNFFMAFTHADWASAAVLSFMSFYKCAFLQQTLPLGAGRLNSLTLPASNCMLPWNPLSSLSVPYNIGWHFCFVGSAIPQTFRADPDVHQNKRRYRAILDLHWTSQIELLSFNFKQQRMLQAAFLLCDC